MHFRRHSIRFLCVLFLLLLLAPGCWDEDSDEPSLVLSGVLTMPDAVRQSDAPVMVAVSRSMDADALASQAADAVIAYVTADKAAGTFRIDLSDAPVSPGDEVYLIAFADNNYTGDVPFPDEGDHIGIYVNEERLSPAYTIKPGANTGIRIDINREVFDYQAAVTGDILGDDTGPVTLVAYTGEITSSDFSALDFDEVMGFARVQKEPGPTPYTLDILPYGKDVPIENLQVFALLDKNQNQQVDAGDRIGFYSTGDDVSTPITLPAGRVGGIDLQFQLTVPEPSGYDIRLSGIVPDAPHQDPDRPVYITVFSAENPAGVFNNPYAALKYFYKVPAGEATYDIDLSRTDIVPGRPLIISALKDNDFAGALPSLTSGDKLGLVQNKKTYQMTTVLTMGTNGIPPSGYDFELNKDVYEFESGIAYDVDLSNAGSYGPESRLIVMALHVDGLNISILPPDLIIDMDYLLGLDIMTAEDDPALFNNADPQVTAPMELPVWTALYEQIRVNEDAAPSEVLIGGRANGTAYLIAVLDKNGNLKIDPEDEVGYYSQSPMLLPTPTPIARITKGINEGPYRISNFFSPDVFVP